MGCEASDAMDDPLEDEELNAELNMNGFNKKE